MAHDLLRLATAGSVDDGKSTLVGRLLYDTKSVLADTMDAVEQVSRDRGLAAPDLALLTDGLRAEREQGITIDVAYRYFATPNRSFILADTPGHVQYTRNMVTGASTAELALILVDARNGVVEQTRRHAAVSALLGVRHIALAVNKMDLVGFDRERVRVDPRRSSTPTPVLTESTTWWRSRSRPRRRQRGDPVTADRLVPRSDAARAPRGGARRQRRRPPSPFRFPVQYVIRPQDGEHHDYRGYAGRVEAGIVSEGDTVVITPSGARSTVVAIDTYDGPLAWAQASQSVTLRLADDIDISRGDLLAAGDAAPSVVRDVVATVTVLAEQALVPRQRLLLKAGSRTVRALVESIASRLDIDTLEAHAGVDRLALNDIGDVRIRLAEPIAFDPYDEIRSTGAFLLIDDQTGATVAAGMVRTTAA